MDLIRFVSWWWKKQNNSEKWLIAFFTWLGLMFPNMFFFGILALPIFIGGVGIVAFCFLFYKLTAGIRGKWAEFKMEREAEAQLIVHKLAGTDVDSHGNELTSEDILSRLRMRANLLRAKKKKAIV